MFEYKCVPLLLSEVALFPPFAVNGRNPAEAAERRADRSPVQRRYYTLILQLDGWTSCLSGAINCCRVSERTRRPGSNYPEHTSSPPLPLPCDHHPPALMVGSYMEVTTPLHTHTHTTCSSDAICRFDVICREFRVMESDL